MMRSVGRASVFSIAGRLLSGRCSRCELKVGKVCCMKLGELMVRVSERMCHQRLLKWRIIPTAVSAHVRLKVPPRQLINAQRIVYVARISANGIAVNDGKLVVEERI